MLRAADAKPGKQALLLLLRYAGLAMRGAVKLEQSAGQSAGEPVMVQLPDEVLSALNAIAEPARWHLFWTGRGKPAPAAKYWRSRLKRVAADAGLKGFHPHRPRDTLAVELLLAGVLMQDVSTLLGHGSVATTERCQSEIRLVLAHRKSAGTVAAIPEQAGPATPQGSRSTRRAYAWDST